MKKQEKEKKKPKVYQMPALTMKEQVVETAKAAILGAAMGFVMSWLVATYIMAFPESAAENAMNNGMSGVMSGLYGGLWGMVMLFITMHLRVRRLAKAQDAGTQAAASEKIPA